MHWSFFKAKSHRTIFFFYYYYMILWNGMVKKNHKQSTQAAASFWFTLCESFDTCFLTLGAFWQKGISAWKMLEDTVQQRAGKRVKKVLRSCNCDQDFPHGECSDTDRYLLNGHCRCTVTQIYLSIYLCVLFNAHAGGGLMHFEKLKTAHSPIEKDPVDVFFQPALSCRAARSPPLCYKSDNVTVACRCALWEIQIRGNPVLPLPRLNTIESGADEM